MLKSIDLFAGIGGFRLGTEAAAFRTVFSSEIDRYARATYSVNFGDEPSGDIRCVAATAIPDHDLLCGGFPCQPFSLAGVSVKNALGRAHGFQDKKSGNLFFEIIRILRHKRPAAIFLENVRNLRSHDKGRTYRRIQQELQAVGYYVYTQLIEARHWVPQIRPRVYIVGFRDRSALTRYVQRFEEEFQHDLFDSVAPRLGSILSESVDHRYTLTEKLWDYLQGYRQKHQKAGHGFGFGLCGPSDVARTLSARYGKDGSEILIRQEASEENPKGLPRRLTPRECARLMGFPEEFQIPVSDSQAYKQFGNAVVVPIIQKIAGLIGETLTQGALSPSKTGVSH